MRRSVCVLAILALCLALVCPVFAAENEFVPSISYKGSPDIVRIEDDKGEPAIGVVLNEEGQVISYIYEACLVVTPVAEAKTSPLIPDDAEALLLSVYDQLNNGTMTIPYEKHGIDLSQNEMVIRDLFDASWLCTDHPVEVAPKGVTVRLIFDLGVDSKTDVYCMTYKNNEWNPIVSCENNGDGTVTCVFEDFCPIEFSVAQSKAPSQTADPMAADMTMWVVLMGVSAAALVVMVMPKNRKYAR